MASGDRPGTATAVILLRLRNDAGFSIPQRDSQVQSLRATVETRRMQGTPLRTTAVTLAVAALLLSACQSGSRRGAIKTVSAPEQSDGDVPVEIVLSDPESAPADLSIEVSTDLLVWRAATVDGSLAALSTSPGGTRHVFTWDSVADLGFRLEGDTWIRITSTGFGGLVDVQTLKVNRILGLLPASQRVRDHMIYFGALDTAKIRTAETHDLVVLYPGQPTVTRAAIADIQDGVDPLDPRDDCIVLGYLNVGEDERTIGKSNAQLLADARFVGNGLGPRVDPRGPGAGGQSLAQIDLVGLPSASSGFASFYLDDNSVEANGVGDGLPDRNGTTGACFANAGDPRWFQTLYDMRLGTEGFAGIEEMLTVTAGAGFGFDGLYLDNIDTCAPNSFTGPGDLDHATFEWTAPGVTWFQSELRRRHSKQVILQNRGLFFFDPAFPHYQFSTGPFVDFLKIENYRLDRDPSVDFDPLAFAINKHNLAPKLTAEAQRFTFQVLTLGYAEGPSIDTQTLVGGSQRGIETLTTDVAEAEQVGFRHYLTDAAGSLVNDFARSRMTTTDSTPPTWSSTYNAFGGLNPPQAPVARVGIQQVEMAVGATTVRWDVALDQNPVTYVLYYAPEALKFNGQGVPTNATRQDLYPARVSTSYANGAGPSAFPFEATSTGLLRNTNYWFCIMARDSAGNWARNRVVLSARTL
jgi:hypothetical protein